MARGAAALSVSVADGEGKPVPNASVLVLPDSATSPATLSRMAVHGQTDTGGKYAAPSLTPGRYRVLATAAAIRWDVPDDLEKVLLAMFQAKDVELEVKASLQISLVPVMIF
jgi:hypothetical protein